MAVVPQFGGLAEAQMRALLGNFGAPMSAVAGGTGYYQKYAHCADVISGAQSELTCNGGVVLPTRKRGREGEIEQHVSPATAAAALPVPGMVYKEAVQLSPPAAGAASTSGRAAEESSSAADALVAELCRQGAEVDALVRAECERMRAWLEHAWKRQRQELVRVVAVAAERRLREKEAELQGARRRAAELEERLRQAAAESQAWCGVARGHETVAAGLRATLDRLLLGGVSVPFEEGVGESDPAAADDAQSCCFAFEAKDAPANALAAVSTSAGNKWACRSCGQGEASVLLLPCRHLCLCKGCEPRLDACPVCLAAKNASIHIADS